MKPPSMTQNVNDPVEHSFRKSKSILLQICKQWNVYQENDQKIDDD